MDDHEARMAAMEERYEQERREFREFLARFDAFLRSRSGNGHDPSNEDVRS
jgi:hypothetical protein